MTAHRTLYEALVAGGFEIDNHESDLYVRSAEGVGALLKEYDRYANARPFRSQIDGKLWWDVPFAFDPWWAARATHP